MPTAFDVTQLQPGPRRRKRIEPKPRTVRYRHGKAVPFKTIGPFPRESRPSEPMVAVFVGDSVIVRTGPEGFRIRKPVLPTRHEESRVNSGFLKLERVDGIRAILAEPMPEPPAWHPEPKPIPRVRKPSRADVERIESERRAIEQKARKIRAKRKARRRKLVESFPWLRDALGEPTRRKVVREYRTETEND